MKPLGLNEIREKFLNFFESKEHLRLPSFSLVPQNDNSLLIINSGMAPLKPYFTGQEIPPNKRVTTCQKCIRTGDIENVGKTVRHGTFFEMLGNFSFGDYFKEEIIPWSWEFVTKELEIPENRLYVSVYLEDQEAYDIWHEKIGLSKDRIFKMGKEDNFWEVGLGPCGPCSEIYYDKGEKYGCGKDTCTVGCDCDRYMEFWNLVFTQFSKEEDGSYSNLAKPNIDTGMGLERIAVMMQDVDSIFDIDTMKAIRDKVCQIANITYNKDSIADVSIRITTDHIRSITFMIADGIILSNEGRGYVLKRLLRRAARHGKLLGIEKIFLSELSQIVIDISKDAYPEIEEKAEYINKVISIEETRFYETLDKGLDLLKNNIAVARKNFMKVLNGKDTFKLYDTYGFPLELMQEILGEEGLSLDEDEFNKEMEHQKEMGRGNRAESDFMGSEGTIYNKLDASLTSEFIGYAENITENATVIALTSKNEILEKILEGQEVSIILDKTPFYAESGGQAGDIGVISSESGFLFEVKDCVKASSGKIAHLGVVKKGAISKSDKVKAEIDIENRISTARNHSATHLLQQALRDIIGKHVEQAGSSVSSDRLRFDFTHFAAMTADEIKKAEDIVNKKILEDISISTSEKTMDEARKLGAMALFGEKYGSVVRVVEMGNYSVELCGGTHVKNAAKIGAFKILTESSAAAGVRRIEAITGLNTLSYFNEMEERQTNLKDLLHSTPQNILTQTKTLILQNKELTKELASLRSQMSAGGIDEILNAKETVGDFNLVIAVVENLEGNELRELGDKVRDKIVSGVVILMGKTEDRINIAAMATEDAVKAGIHAGNILKETVAVLGGNGGGRPNMAMAGAKDISKIPEATEKAKEVIKRQLKI